jgi:hypothetical protein
VINIIVAMRITDEYNIIPYNVACMTIQDCSRCGEKKGEYRPQFLLGNTWCKPDGIWRPDDLRQSVWASHLLKMTIAGIISILDTLSTGYDGITHLLCMLFTMRPAYFVQYLEGHQGGCAAALHFFLFWLYTVADYNSRGWMSDSRGLRIGICMEFLLSRTELK